MTLTANEKYYLRLSDNSWQTMSLSRFRSSYASIFVVGNSGALDGNYYASSASVSSTNGVRSVINLRSDVTITGNGSIDMPFEVS